MILKITKTKDNAIIPSYAHADDSGVDLHACENSTIAPGQFKIVSTGLKIELPKMTEAQIRPRSGLAIKNGITVLNTPGTIDEGYRGEIGVILINHSKDPFHISEGMRIAQMVIVPVVRPTIIESHLLTETNRGDCGFGSTGNN